MNLDSQAAELVLLITSLFDNFLSNWNFFCWKEKVLLTKVEILLYTRCPVHKIFSLGGCPSAGPVLSCSLEALRRCPTDTLGRLPKSAVGHS